MPAINNVKIMLLSTSGLLFSAAGQALGGYDSLLEALIAFMVIDFVTGCLVAAVFKRSQKTESGRLASGAIFRGLIKKGCMLMLIVVAVKLDEIMQTPCLTRDAVMIALILNELVSILENMGLMGIKLPNALTDALEMLGKKRTP